MKNLTLRPSKLLVATFIAACGLASSACRADRPNILWIVSEDNGPFLGCYGDEEAVTPNLDRLASQGVLYENAFANAPVCAPSRSTIITGMYASSLGTLHMRSVNPLPEGVRFFTEYLREAGYHCTNRHKEDYNTIKPEGAWDESSKWASWTRRQKDQPFFAVVNLTESHESTLHETVSTIHDPEAVRLPPYHPDTPEIRHDWAQYYDSITEMDGRVGEILDELDREGLADDTIVFYYADHGGVLTRSKRFVYDSGTHVPSIIRFPEKFNHLAPGEPGSRTDRLIAFVDLAPTVLSLAGDSEYEDVLRELREVNRRWLLEVRDPALLPEAEMGIRSEGGSPYDLARGERFDFEALLVTAEAAGGMDPSNLDAFIDLLQNADSGVRYWAVQGLIALGEEARPASEALRIALRDPSPDVRISAAEALGMLGHTEAGSAVLEEAMRHDNLYVRLHAINVIDCLDKHAGSLHHLLEAAATNQDDSKYIRRVAIKALADLEGVHR